MVRSIGVQLEEVLSTENQISVDVEKDHGIQIS